MKVRKNALHRVYAEMKDRIEAAGFTLDPDTRKLQSGNVGYTLRSYSSSAECKKMILGVIRPIEMSAKISKEIINETIKRKLDNPLL